jgi:hypothetical protein
MACFLGSVPEDYEGLSRCQPDATPGQGVGKLWARNKIASLEGRRYTDPAATELSKEIESVALEHHIVSSETSLVAVDVSKLRPDGQDVTTTDMPVNLPDGWKYDKVFGAPPMQRAMAPTGAVGSYGGGQLARSLRVEPLPAPSPTPYPAMAGLPSDDGPQADAMAVPGAGPDADMPDASASAPSSEGAGVKSLDGGQAAQPQADSPKVADPLMAEPQVATPDVPKPQPTIPVELQRQVAMALLVLAILSAVTLLVWRYHRRDHASPRRIGRRI